MKKNVKKIIKRIGYFIPRLFQRILLHIIKEPTNFKYGLSIVAIVKNEGDYIVEWIRYHQLIGVDHFYIFDNDSTDDTIKYLKSFSEDKLVTIINFPGKAMQLPAYTYAIKHFKNETEFMAFIDADEFINLIDHKKSVYPVIKVLVSKDTNAGGLAINWCMFGSSNYEQKPEGGVLENFLWRAKDDFSANECIKTIANPRRIFKYELSHYPIYCMGFHSIDEKGNIVPGWSNKFDSIETIKLNHYFTKSKEEWIKRRSMGKAEGKNGEERTLEEFIQHDRNEIYDPCMIEYAEILRDMVR